MLSLHQSEFPDGCSCVTTYREKDFKRRIGSAKHPIGCHCGEHGLAGWVSTVEIAGWDSTAIASCKKEKHA